MRHLNERISRHIRIECSHVIHSFHFCILVKLFSKFYTVSTGNISVPMSGWSNGEDCVLLKMWVNTLDCNNFYRSTEWTSYCNGGSITCHVFRIDQIRKHLVHVIFESLEIRRQRFVKLFVGVHDIGEHVVTNDGFFRLDEKIYDLSKSNRCLHLVLRNLGEISYLYPRQFFFSQSWLKKNCRGYKYEISKEHSWNILTWTFLSFSCVKSNFSSGVMKCTRIPFDFVPLFSGWDSKCRSGNLEEWSRNFPRTSFEILGTRAFCGMHYKVPVRTNDLCPSVSRATVLP